jgi:hypothetical protein
MENDIQNRKVYNDCENKPHCPAVKYMSDDAIFVTYDENANCPYRINLGDSNICEHIGRIRYYTKFGK